jgi:hypothetical protein
MEETHVDAYTYGGKKVLHHPLVMGETFCSMVELIK